MPDPSIPSPEQIREFPDRGTLWLLEDPTMLQDLLRVLEPALAEQLDFRRAIRINRSLVPADLQKQESDLIFQVPLVGPEPAVPEVWIYVLLEHQSKPDPLMPLRLLEYLLLLWQSQVRDWEAFRTPARQRRLRPVVPVVFYTGRRGWRTPLRLADLMETPEELRRFIPSWETLFLNLHRISPETLTNIATGVGWALRVLQAEQAPREELERVLAEAMAGLEGLTEEQAGQWLRVAWFFTLLVFHRRDQQEYTELGRQIQEQAGQSRFRLTEEMERMAKSMAEVMEERGRASGLRQALETVLVGRFGPLPAATQAALASADLDTLDLWLRQAANARTLAEVGITTHEPPR